MIFNVKAADVGWFRLGSAWICLIWCLVFQNRLWQSSVNCSNFKSLVLPVNSQHIPINTPLLSFHAICPMTRSTTRSSQSKSIPNGEGSVYQHAPIGLLFLHFLVITTHLFGSLTLRSLGDLDWDPTIFCGKLTSQKVTKGNYAPLRTGRHQGTLPHLGACPEPREVSHRTDLHP